MRLLFWSGQGFTEPGLEPEGRFEAAGARYQAPDDVALALLAKSTQALTRGA